MRPKTVYAVTVAVVLLAGCTAAAPPTGGRPSAAPASAGGSPSGPVAESPASEGPADGGPSPSGEPSPRVVEPAARIDLEGPDEPAPGGSIVVTDDLVWVSSATGLHGIDPRTNTVARTIPMRTQIERFAIASGTVWGTNFEAGVVRRLDLATGKVVGTTPAPDPDGLAIGGDAVWVSNHRAGTVSRIDAASGKVVSTISVGQPGPGGPAGMAFADGAVWVAVPNAGSLVRIDPASNEVSATVALKQTVPCGVDVIDGTAWAHSCLDREDRLALIDARSATLLAEIDPGGPPLGPAVLDGEVWFSLLRGPAYRQQGRLVRLDPATGQRLDEIGLGEGVEALEPAVGFDSLWLSEFEARSMESFGALPRVLRYAADDLAAP